MVEGRCILAMRVTFCSMEGAHAHTLDVGVAWWPVCVVANGGGSACAA